jgi:hypothetical protein
VNFPNFFAELKRRNVYKVAIAYGVVAWLLMQVASQIFPFFEIPNWAVRLVVLLLVIGFPVAMILAWAFELTPEGVKQCRAAYGYQPLPASLPLCTEQTRQKTVQKQSLPMIICTPVFVDCQLS